MKKKITGNVKYDPSVDYSGVTEITGTLNCYGANTKAAFPKLKTIGGTLNCSGADTKAAFPKLEMIGGRLDCYGANTKAAFPKLTKKNIGDTKYEKEVAKAFILKGFLFADGILSKITSTKQAGAGAKIHTVVTVGKSKKSYCIESDGTFSHGDTLKEARESLVYKIGDRDKSAYENWTPETMVSKKEAIESYRVITGACESGVRRFVESSGLENRRKFTVGEVIKITEGQYRNDSYREFFGK